MKDWQIILAIIGLIALGMIASYFIGKNEHKSKPEYIIEKRIYIKEYAGDTIFLYSKYIEIDTIKIK